MECTWKKTNKNDGTCHNAAMNEEDSGHIPSMLICNSLGLFGKHITKEVSNAVIKLLNYIRKHLSEDNQESTLTTKGEQHKYFTNRNFKVCRLQIDQQDDGWSCGYWSLLARQNFLQILSEKVKFNKELFRKQNGTIILEKMTNGTVSEIRHTLFQILTFLEKKKTNKTPIPDKKNIFSIDTTAKITTRY